MGPPEEVDDKVDANEIGINMALKNVGCLKLDVLALELELRYTA